MSVSSFAWLLKSRRQKSVAQTPPEAVDPDPGARVRVTVCCPTALPART